MGRKPKARTMMEHMAEASATQRAQIPPLALAEGPSVEVQAERRERMMREAIKIEMWPLDRLVDHPDNPRTVNVKSAKFEELKNSIAANGVIEPLTVREVAELPPGVRQVLSGHRRKVAARLCGQAHVPVRNLGLIPDDLAYDIVAMGNLHEDLTPLEEGKRAATWLDKYHEDAAAVAAKLGKTAHWVMIHAQIHRGLSADWRKAIEDLSQWDQERSHWVRLVHVWTAEHWARVARLSLRVQAEQLTKFHKDNRYFNADEWTVKDLEERLKIDLLYLAQAPFPTGEGTKCAGCPERTGVQPLLFGEAAEEATGGKERCLNPQCWQSRAAKALREQYEAERVKVVEAGGVTPAAIVPVSFAQVPADSWSGSSARLAYNAKLKPVKNAIKGLLEADRIKVVTAKTKGAVPGIVMVGGKGKGQKKGSLVWVKIEERKESGRGGPRPPSAAELAREKAKLEKKQRWAKVYAAAYKDIAARGKVRPSAEKVLLYCYIMNSWLEGRATYRQEKRINDRIAGWLKLLAAGRGDKLQEEILEACWRCFLAGIGNRAVRMERVDRYTGLDFDKATLEDLAPLYGIDLNQEYNARAAEEKGKGKEEKPVAEGCPVEAGTGECLSDGDCERCGRRPLPTKPAQSRRGRKKKAAAAPVGAT